jgi:hypothetical protein
MFECSKTLDDFNFKLIDLILWSISDELSDDPIKGWLKANGSITFLAKQKKETYTNNPTSQINALLREIQKPKPNKKYTKIRGLQEFLNWKAS